MKAIKNGIVYDLDVKSIKEIEDFRKTIVQESEKVPSKSLEERVAAIEAQLGITNERNTPRPN